MKKNKPTLILFGIIFALGFVVALIDNSAYPMDSILNIGIAILQFIICGIIAVVLVAFFTLAMITLESLLNKKEDEAIQFIVVVLSVVVGTIGAILLIVDMV